jgi:hypothetical protein
MGSESDGKKNPLNRKLSDGSMAGPKFRAVLPSGHRWWRGVLANKAVRGFYSAEPDELGEPLAHDLIFQNAAARSPTRRFLIPIDALT